MKIINRVIICYIFMLVANLWIIKAKNILKKRVLLQTKDLTVAQVKQLAEKHGFKLINRMKNFQDMYILTPDETIFQNNKRNKIPKTEKFKNEPKVLRAIDEKWKIRDPRGITTQSFTEDINDSSLLNIKDPYFSKQWYIHNSGQITNQFLLDINILPVWNRGYNGQGVTIAILDDGIDYTNPDIYHNYDRLTSYDYQNMDEDPSPLENLESSHGTRCASIAAGSTNSYCGIGVAYNATIAGIRMLDLKTTDSIEANAVGHKIDFIDIYSCNWGPRDDGIRFGGPGPLTTKALKLGTMKGRNGLGSIYVWSSGNGGLEGDDCNADGYITNLYTLAIGAVALDGQVPLYAETCSSVFAVTFSGSITKNSNRNIMINSDIGGQCKESFEGTSSASSIAAGLIALTLEANPSLSWRDLHHIIVESSQIVNPSDSEWTRNGAGKWFNPKYGFGRLDALELVHTAYQWKNVDPKQLKCKISYQKIQRNYNLYEGGTMIISFNDSKCDTKGKDNDIIKISNKITKIEHVQLIVTLSHECRGRMDLFLISPSGTKSHILKPRPKDKSSKGLQEWIFKSVHFWGEIPNGQWSLVFSDSINVDPCNMQNKTTPTIPPTNSQTTLLTTTPATPQNIHNNNKDVIQQNDSNIINNDNNSNNQLLNDKYQNTSNLTESREKVPNVNSSEITEDNLTNESRIDINNVKKLYDVINNISELSERLLKIQENSTTNDTKFDHNTYSKQPLKLKNKPETILHDYSDINEEDGAFKEDMKKIDTTLSNDTKLYERVILEKLRVSPDIKRNSQFKTDANHMNKQQAIDTNDESQLASSYISDDDDDDDDYVPVQQKKRIIIPSHKSLKKHIKPEQNKITHKINLNQKIKRSNIKNPTKKLNYLASQRKIVGSFESMTLIIYGT